MKGCLEESQHDDGDDASVPPAGRSPIVTRHASATHLAVRSTSLWGQPIEAVFPAWSGPVASIWWWPEPTRLKRKTAYQDGLVTHAVLRQSNSDLRWVDPRTLRPTQGGVTKGGVQYYLEDTYELTGETWMDKEKLNNRFPLIYIRDEEQSLILAGHHRSTASLLKGEMLLAIVVRGTWGDSR